MARSTRTTTKPKRDIHQTITDRIVERLEQGIVPWRPGWQGVPHSNPLRHKGEAYNGINTLILWAAATTSGYQQPRWMTYRQARELGGNVRKGEKGETVVYANTYKPKDSEPNEPARSFLRSYTVFNVEQIDNLHDDYITPVPELVVHDHKPIEPIDSFIRNAGVTLEVSPNARAAYNPELDVVIMPDLWRFETVENYYQTLFHEALHWTGHKSRLDRDKKEKFGDPKYAFEELVAELGSAFLSSQFELKADYEGESAAYIQSWINRLRSDKRLIFAAAAKASQAVKYINDKQPALRVLSVRRISV